MTDLRKLQRTWTRWARIYDLRVRLFLRWRQTALDALRPSSGDTVLDLACGTGLNFRYITERIGPKGRVVGVDFTRAMLQQAQRKIRRHHWAAAALIEADAAALPLANESCDGVLCSYGMMIIPDYRRAIAEAVRALKPGGRFVMLEGKRGSAAWARPVNPLVEFAGRFGGVHLDRRPWEDLPAVLENVSRTDHLGGIVYIASGTKKSNLKAAP